MNFRVIPIPIAATAVVLTLLSCRTLIAPKAALTSSHIESSAAPGEGFVLSQSDLDSLSAKSINQCLAVIQMPSENQAFADSSNFGNREPRDFLGRSLLSSPKIIVIHETVLGESDTIKLFQTHHPKDEDQVSYHMLIGRNGRLVRIVPDNKRAYGAGMSQFMGSTLRSKKGGLGSINNIALHVSLVSPSGYPDSDSHSGYTQSQYEALARQVLKWQIMYGIPMYRVTTHYAVDRSHSRYDPRSFHWDKFDAVHDQLAAACHAQQFAQPV